MIEKAAGERAQREIDERLQGAYAARARAKQAGQPFADAALLNCRFPSALPEALRPRPGQLTAQQQRVYEDFSRIPRTAAAAQQSAGQPRPVGGQPGEPGEPGTGAPGMPGPGGASMQDAEQAAAAAGATGMAPPHADLRSRFISWLQRMDQAVAKDPQAPFASLSDGSGERVGWGSEARAAEGRACGACVPAPCSVLLCMLPAAATHPPSGPRACPPRRGQGACERDRGHPHQRGHRTGGGQEHFRKGVPGCGVAPPRHRLRRVAGGAQGARAGAS